MKDKFTILANLTPAQAIATSKETSASLDSLKELLPEEDFVKDNEDLLFVAFNLFTANLANKNHDLVLKDDAIAMAEKSYLRFADYEHNRYNVVGAIVNSGFSSFETNELIEDPNVLGEFDLFNVACSSVVWRKIDEWFAEILEESADPRSWLHEVFSASFEVGFDSIWIAKGSPNAAHAEIIKDQEEIDKLRPHLMAYGGTGYDTSGTPLYRIARGCKLIGFGFVENPAGSVKGLVSGWKNKKDKKIAASAKIDKNSGVLKLEKKIIMVDELNDLTQDELQASKPSDIKRLFEKEMDRQSKALKDSLASAEDLVKQREEEVASLKDSVEDLNKKVQDLLAEKTRRDQDDLFQMRMEEISEAVELSAKAKKVVADSIRTLDDAHYESWKEGFITLMASRSEATNIDEERDANEALVRVEETQASAVVVNTAAEENEPSLEETFAGLFKVGENVQISTRKFN